MQFLIRRLFFAISFNLCLFCMLMIGIQNSSYKNKVNFLISETVELPLSFILGSSFISGSILGSIVNLNLANKKSQ